MGTGGFQNIRISRALHARLKIEAAMRGKPLGEYVEEKLSKKVPAKRKAARA